MSMNLMDWTMLLPMIYLTVSFNMNGCWSGSIVLPDGTPTIMYTDIDVQN
jgi:sucrose-6-phosphate hydrolase SacC (GH32 family)